MEGPAFEHISQSRIFQRSLGQPTLRESGKKYITLLLTTHKIMIRQAMKRIR